MILKNINRYFDKEVHEDGRVFMVLKPNYQLLIANTLYAYYMIDTDGTVLIRSSEGIDDEFDIILDSVDAELKHEVMLNKITQVRKYN